MRLAIYGTPCGGTQHTSLSLRAVGIDAGHEKMGADGFVCGWAAFSLRKLKPTPADHEWRLLRDPLSTLETLPGYVQRTARDGRVMPWAHDDRTLAALGWWVCLHETYAHLPALRLEDMDWPALTEPLLGYVPDRPMVERSSKPRRFPRPTWADLKTLAPDLTDRALRILES